MTKHKVNHYKYITFEDVEGLNHTATVENTSDFSLHLNDRIIIKLKGQEHYRAVRVIKRSNVKGKLTEGWEITHTNNQFPVADHPVQPELPVVPHATRLHELTKQLEDAIIQIRTLI